MPVHLCARCNHESATIQALLRHLHKKKTCPSTASDEERADIINTIMSRRDDSNMEHMCPSCSKRFASQSGLCHHIKICKNAQPPIEPTDEVKVVKAPTDAIVRSGISSTLTTSNENYYQALLENMLGCGHKRVSTGVTDITSDGFHAEIKRWTCWSEALGQLLKYQSADPKSELRVYLFGDFKAKNVALEVFKKHAIRVFDMLISDTSAIEIVELSCRGECKPSWKVAVDQALEFVAAGSSSEDALSV